MKIQEELDRAEIYVLNKLIKDVNNPVIGKKIQLMCIAANIDINGTINENIKKFESFIRDYMTESGYVDGKRLTMYITTKYPNLIGLEIPSVKLTELFTIADSLIGFDSLGNIIQNL